MGQLGLGCCHGPALPQWLNSLPEDRELVLQGDAELAEGPCWVHDVRLSATSEREAQETRKPTGGGGGAGTRAGDIGCHHPLEQATHNDMGPEGLE